MNRNAIGFIVTGAPSFAGDPLDAESQGWAPTMPLGLEPPQPPQLPRAHGVLIVGHAESSRVDVSTLPTDPLVMEDAVAITAERLRLATGRTFRSVEDVTDYVSQFTDAIHALNLVLDCFRAKDVRPLSDGNSQHTTA